MPRSIAIVAGAIVVAAAIGSAQQPSNGGPYKVLKSVKVGGEGGWDYIYADAAGRRSVHSAPRLGRRRGDRRQACGACGSARA